MMNLPKQIVALALLALTALIVAQAFRPAIATHAAQQPRRAQPGQEEFVPLAELPPEEQLPAAPLLVAAYAFVWIVLLVYLWSIWRRLHAVERELAEIARRVGRSEGR